MDYAIGRHSLQCVSCGAINPIESVRDNQQSHDYELTRQRLSYLTPQSSQLELHCDNCGATFLMAPDQHAGDCPYCDLNIVVPAEKHRQLAPDYVLPFAVDDKTAANSFKQWLRRLWFAPSKLKLKAFKSKPMQAIYMPMWSFDAQVSSDYQGRRGDYYTTYRTVTQRINGRTQTSRQAVQKIRWRSVSGHVFNVFKHVYTFASKALPDKFLSFLSHWDFHQAQDYKPEYLSGFQSQLYQLGIDVGYAQAKQIMDEVIRTSIRQDIGGDQQQILRVNSVYSEVKFRLVLVPVYLAAFSYQNKIYRYVIHGQTGRTYGERPWSWLKISAAVLLLVTAIAAFFNFQRLIS
ncbi:MAG: primosomal protein N' (replication factor Y) - superfamily II helicase [Proteobacteria bacterium]|nr:MAG: primosomal protein N' (replication factor Y) - superfamily II helicase [Pseudomonadota bacterium]